MKEEVKSPENKKLNEMASSKLPDTEFKMLKELTENLNCIKNGHGNHKKKKEPVSNGEYTKWNEKYITGNQQ